MKIFLILLSLISFSFSQSYLLSEDWEGTGANGWSRGGGGTADYDNTSPTMQGNQNVKLTGGTVVISKSLTDTSTTVNWFFFMFNTSNATAANELFIKTKDASGITVIGVYKYTSGKLKVHYGTYSALTTTVLQNNTNYYIWIYQVPATSSNEIVQLYISSTPIRPESPEISITNGSQKRYIKTIELWGYAGRDYNYDYILFDNEEIGNVLYVPPATTTTTRKRNFGGWGNWGDWLK